MTEALALESQIEPLAIDLAKKPQCGFYLGPRHELPACA